jgi:hypothetical protein
MAVKERDEIDDLIAQAGLDDPEEDDIDALISQAGLDEEPPPPEEKLTPSKALGNVAKGLGSYMLQGLPDVPYIAKKSVETVKGLGGAVGQLFKKENYTNAIDHPVQAAKGAAKGLGGTALGIGASIAADSPALRQIKSDLHGDPTINYTPPKRLQPSTDAEQAGANLAGSALAVGGTLLSAKPIMKAGFKAVSSPNLAAGAKSLGNRLQNRTTKILAKEADSGAKVENIGKHGLFGAPEVALKKGKAIVDDSYSQLKQKIQENNIPDNYKNINELLEEAQIRALSKATENREGIVNAFENIKKDYLGSDKAPGYFKSETIDLADAQMLKQDAAGRSEWHHLPINAKGDNAKGAAYKEISNVLREQLEEAGGPEIRELNRKMSEVIPINTANAKRLLVSSRNNPIPIDDFVGYLTSASSLAHGNPLPAMLTAGNKIIKSPAFAEKIYNLGDKMTEKPVVKKYAKEFGGETELPSDWNIPAYQRKGTRVEPGDVGLYPLEEKTAPNYTRKALLAPMVGGNTNIQKPIPSIGDRIRAIGNPNYKDLYPDQKKLPSPEDVKGMYPHLSKENVRPMAQRFDDRKALPAPMVGDPDIPFKKEPMLPTPAERIRAIGTNAGKETPLPSTSALTIVPDQELVDMLQKKGIIEEMLKLKEGVPVNMSKDQLDAMQDFVEYMTKNKGSEALRKTKYQEKKTFKKKY